MRKVDFFWWLLIATPQKKLTSATRVPMNVALFFVEGHAYQTFWYIVLPHVSVLFDSRR
jgi:hypothetical protein